MQRMGYALKKNEINVPKNVQKVFDTLVNAIEDGIDEMKPGVKGYKIDSIVRKQILKKGYPDYNPYMFDDMIYQQKRHGSRQILR